MVTVEQSFPKALIGYYIEKRGGGLLQAVLDGASEPTSNTAGVLRHNPSGMDFSIQLLATNQCVYPADQIRSAGADIISVIVLSTYVSIFLQVRNSACRGGHLWLALARV